MKLGDSSLCGNSSVGWRLVLLVDQGRAQRRALAVRLKRAGYDVIEAARVDEALQICESQRPDIVVSDWGTSGWQGLDFCRRFREMAKERHGYFILLPSRTDKLDIVEGLRAGADEFLTKPVSGAELLARPCAGERIRRMKESLRQANLRLKDKPTKLREREAVSECDLPETQRLVGFFPMDANKIGLFALNVSDHGVPAMLSASLTALLTGRSNITLPCVQRARAGSR